MQQYILDQEQIETLLQGLQTAYGHSKEVQQQYVANLEAHHMESPEMAMEVVEDLENFAHMLALLAKQWEELRGLQSVVTEHYLYEMISSLEETPTVEAVADEGVEGYDVGVALGVDFVMADRWQGEESVEEVVETVELPETEISLLDARKKDKRFEIGDVVEVDVTPANFGRSAAHTAKQMLIQRLKEAERSVVYEEYYSREGDIITGVITRVEGKNVFIDLGKTEAILPPTEQIATETYREGDRIKCYIVEVKKTTKGPQIMISRTHPGLLKRLFELEVPEIFEGVVELKSVAREPGMRSKIAVYSRDENVDPVGACVGPKGQRVQHIVDELHDEKIDIVKWDEDPAIYIANSLSPAKVISVDVSEEEKSSYVVVPDYQLSLAIGKAGQNARLAAKLTNWKIDIKSETQAAEEPFTGFGNAEDGE